MLIKELLQLVSEPGVYELRCSKYRSHTYIFGVDREETGLRVCPSNWELI